MCTVVNVNIAMMTEIEALYHGIRESEVKVGRKDVPSPNTRFMVQGFNY